MLAAVTVDSAPVVPMVFCIIFPTKDISSGIRRMWYRNATSAAIKISVPHTDTANIKALSGPKVFPKRSMLASGPKTKEAPCVLKAKSFAQAFVVQVKKLLAKGLLNIRRAITNWIPTPASIVLILIAFLFLLNSIAIPVKTSSPITLINLSTVFALPLFIALHTTTFS